MKITFVIPFASLAGGIRVVATYARLLQARGHVVTVVSQPPTPPNRRRDRWARKLGLFRWTPPPITPLLHALGDRHRITDRPRPITADDLPDADVIIATWWETAEWVAQLPPAKGRQFYLLQGYEARSSQPPERIAATYDLGLGMIAVSGYIARMLRQNHGREVLAVCANGVDGDQFAAPPRDKGDPVRIGFLYSKDSYKGTPLAIAALERARAANPALRVVAFGKDDPRRHYPLPDWIDYQRTPDQAQIPRIYASCDAWLFPSEHEGFGLPILEAMGCRTPVLATDAGAAADLITDGVNGRILSADPDAFAAAIADIAAMSATEWRAMSDAALATADRHGWDDATDRLLAVLDGAALQSRAGGSR